MPVDPDATYAEALSSYEEPLHPPRRSGPSGARKIIALLLVLGVLAVAAAVVYVAFGSTTDVKPGQKVEVTIPAAADAGTIVDILAEKGVVKNKVTFAARLRYEGKGALFRAGTYTMTTHSDFDRIVAQLEEGPPPAPTFDISIPEGLRITDIAELIDKLRSEAEPGGDVLPKFTGKEYLAAVQAASLPAGFKPADPSKVPAESRMEGFLFPATFELKTDADAATLVAKQLEAFQENWSEVDLTRARKGNLSNYEVVTIASMIEREAQVAEERPLVAAVLYNRLREGMSLGIDATVQYAVGEWKNNLTVSDLDIDSPYNTRKFVGMPPTPIANPGLSSLEAAGAPADVEYLYYVAKPDGSGEHFFTNTYDEFLAKQ